MFAFVAAFAVVVLVIFVVVVVISCHFYRMILFGGVRFQLCAQFDFPSSSSVPVFCITVAGN